MYINFIDELYTGFTVSASTAGWVPIVSQASPYRICSTGILQ